MFNASPFETNFELMMIVLIYHAAHQENVCDQKTMIIIPVLLTTDDIYLVTLTAKGDELYRDCLKYDLCKEHKENFSAAIFMFWSVPDCDNFNIHPMFVKSGCGYSTNKQCEQKCETALSANRVLVARVISFTWAAVIVDKRE